MYSVTGTLVDRVESLLSALNVLKTAEAIGSQAERAGGLHYLVF
jgi:hypothetical protein